MREGDFIPLYFMKGGITMTDEQKIVFAQERWIKTINYFHSQRCGVMWKEPSREEMPYIRDAISKEDLSVWKIKYYHDAPCEEGINNMTFLLFREDDHEEKNPKSLNILELDEEFYTRARYEQIISENRKRFLDVPMKIGNSSHKAEFTFQQKLTEDSYVYIMRFWIPDKEHPEIFNSHERLVTLTKAEILDGIKAPEALANAQIEIFRILQKEGIVK